MTVHLGKLLQMIQQQAGAVSTALASMQKQGTSISVVSMITMQMYMNKFSQIADLGSTTVSVFNQSFKTMISNILR
jgi:predicted lipid-binding transport protein (Tim44 family)